MATRSDGDLLLDFRTALVRGHAAHLHLLQTQMSRAERIHSTELREHLRRGIEELQLALSVSHSPTGTGGIPGNTTEAELVAQFRKTAPGLADGLAGGVETRKVAADLTEAMIRSKSMLPG
jgi:hypothetical protein